MLEKCDKYQVILLGTSSPIDAGSGINSYVREVAQALVGEGHKVIITSPEPTDETWLNAHDIGLIAVDQYSNPIEAAQTLIEKIFREGVSAIINSDNPILQSVAPVVDCPFVSVMHLGTTNIASLACYNLDWLDHLVVISNEMRYRALDRYAVPPSKAVLVFNGIADPLPDWSLNSSHNRKLRVLYNGGANKRKGFDLLRNAITRCSRDWKNMELHVFGHVDPINHKELNRYSFVKLHGKVPRPEMLSALENMDVFLMPSRQEGCPMALIEAMAYGLVPISTDGEGAMDTIIDSGIDGYICQLSSWDTQVMQCLKFLDKDRDVLAHLSQHARSKFRQAFQVRRTVSKLLGLIDTPTVDRSCKPEEIDVLRWHRPSKVGSMKAPLLDRFLIRFGWLRKYGSARIRQQGPI